MWNTSDVSLEYAAQVTVDAAKVMSDKGLKWNDQAIASAPNSTSE
jgi:hypothetical protein